MGIPSKAALRALTIALYRPRHNICPIVGCHAAAEQAVLDSLTRNGWAKMDGPAPRITDAGAAIARGALSQADAMGGGK